MIEAINTALTAFEASEARALIIESDVPEIFIAGADIKEMKQTGAEGFKAYGSELRQLFNRIEKQPRPVVAAIDGLALGGGMELAMACHLRVGSTTAAIGFPEPKLGLIPGAGGTQRLPLAIGKSRALDLLLTGRTVNADEAHQFGILNSVTDSGEASTAAARLANRMSQLSETALAAILRVVEAGIDRDTSGGMHAETQAVDALFQSGDALEGITAFLEKRPPNFAFKA
jgi:enoyl-CoA hydratase